MSHILSSYRIETIALGTRSMHEASYVLYEVLAEMLVPVDTHQNCCTSVMKRAVVVRRMEHFPCTVAARACQPLFY